MTIDPKKVLEVIKLADQALAKMLGVANPSPPAPHPSPRRDPLDAPAPADVRVIGVVRRGEQYLFLYTDSQREELLKTLDRFAADPELGFTRTDAAILRAKVGDGSSRQ